MTEEKKTTLEEAAEKFVYDWAGLTPTERRIAERAYLAGAEWQKEQMMKEAVEGEIGYVKECDAHYLSVYDPDELEGIILFHYDVGDKVKIIIVKNDD